MGTLITSLDIMMDVKRLDFKPATFDAVIDKGTLDTVLVLSCIDWG